MKKFASDLGVYENSRKYIIIKMAEKRFIRGGKRFRPLLAYATYRALTQRDLDKKILSFMVAGEIIHGGLLDIDDVQDRSLLRRGKPATWTLIGKENAINTGLFSALAIPYELFSLLTEDLTRRQISELLRAISLMLREVSIGQSLDIEFRRSEKLNEQIQLKIYEKKTGSYTVGGPLACSAIIADRSYDFAKKLYELGRKYFGIGFQIIDDLLNLSSPKKYGKEFADDLNEGKPTYMVALFNQRAGKKEKKEFYKLFGRMEPPLTFNERMKLIKLMDKFRVREDSRKVAEKFVEKGMKKLEKLIPRTKRSRLLYELLEFAVTRNW
jgi:geranylgeranyl pyrophosphate synthase